ncbi:MULTISPECIES: MFS transporter [unclassified Bacillus (in: firmicutes)]|uniref:MFS transporter n=1 Tax=unclassified Bacillus (in: firmicutes) TaxID=185979 RepID=UPI0008E523C6|nr:MULTISPECIES: MFS transporter [unclassified Bacillus (in: firmicutes)]PGZ94174.1 MFS transporter [Bacillus sp. AFS029533]SFD19136.1 Predicted arabinose efflux permease, MFS family [Bacillus sp. UNCCL81]
MAQIEVQNKKNSRFAFQSKSFNTFMAGSLISRVGDWMDLVALNWAVLQFTNSPIHLGIMNACRLVPTFLLSVPAGIMADRLDRRKLLIWLQVGMMLLTFVIGFLVAKGPAFWLFALIVTIRSMLAAMDPPIRNALIPNLVPESSMASALAVNTMIINLSRIIGPAIAGILLGITNIANLFYINAWGTFAVLISLAIIRADYQSIKYKDKDKDAKITIKEAVDFVKKKPSVQSLLILAIVPMVFGFPYTTMTPLFAKELLHLGPEGFGVLLSISSIGAIIGTSWLSVGKEIIETGKWLIYSIIGFGLSLLLFIGTNNYLVAGLAMFLVGLTSQTYRTLSRITLQKQVPDHLRGRIMSIALMDRGFIPLGALLIGAMASSLGILWAGSVMGLGCILTTLMIVLKRREILKV